MPNYDEAFREYYLALLPAGIIHKKTNSPKKNAALLTPQWCTSGEQVAAHCERSRLDFTRPEVEKVISDVARRFVRWYKPNLVKFDFGDEIPSLDLEFPVSTRFSRSP